MLPIKLGLILHWSGKKRNPTIRTLVPNIKVRCPKHGEMKHGPYRRLVPLNKTTRAKKHLLGKTKKKSGLCLLADMAGELGKSGIMPFWNDR